MFGEQRPKDTCLSLRGCGWHQDALTSQRDCVWGEIRESLLSLTLWLTQAFEESMTEVGGSWQKPLWHSGSSWGRLDLLRRVSCLFRVSSFKELQIVRSMFQADQDDIFQLNCDFISIISDVCQTLEMNNKTMQDEVNNHASIAVYIIRDFT